jgi:hypothetical protein
MKTMTKLFALGALGAGAYAAVRAKQKATAAAKSPYDSFDLSDLDEPFVAAEEVIVVTEAGPYEIDMELIPIEEAANQNQQSDQSNFEMPGRGAAPR